MTTRASSLFAIAWLFLACGGSEFTSDPGTGGGAGVSGDASVTTGGSSGIGGAATGGMGGAITGGTGGDTTGGSGGVAATGGVDAGSGGVDAGSGGTDGGAGSDAGQDGGGGADASDDAGGTDAGDDAGVIVKCPSSPPPLTSACAKGLVCTYGAHPNADCRVSYTCTDSGWTKKTPICDPVTPCKNLPQLPVIGKPCTDIDAGVLSGTACSQTDPKILCRCVCIGAGCQPGKEEWSCAGPLVGCPDVLPNQGQPCTKPNPSNSCPYYGCTFGWATEAKCKNSTWQWFPLSCP